ncbi:DUF4157 domain-containing protein [Sphingomonas sp. HF-S4]|uniref:DUF4157 domain-containing protein n=1 Tax=Sphingomonas agrestis TaxID=3080540 RepID=A0ABU3YBE4_9SPHN|nr:DUF4157 domain-containing protein [Sphingomonas sp. HF-S4]MDV3458624.1 DUF4157 domain-containing protein [Sphingomonas sp. HF-S4]
MARAAFEKGHDTAGTPARRSARANVGRAYPAQCKAGADPGRLSYPARPNRTGLPDSLKAGVETLSGIRLDDVAVHYGSGRPAQLGAHAFAMGCDIHVAPGQERHLAHEAWHIVQQKQGRVPATAQAAGQAINDDGALEREADVMGSRALAMGHRGDADASEAQAPSQRATPAAPVIQREPTDAEKQKLAAKVGLAYPNFQFRTVDGVEYAASPKEEYRLIRFQNGTIHWRTVPRKHIGGKSFYGRLGDNPLTMSDVGARTVERQMWEDAPYTGAPAKTFVPQSSIGDRDNNNKVMGDYFLDGLAPMPASIYARTPNYEWLHMQGHGLGGGETEDNLYAGSHAANSHMAAIETAAQKLAVSVRPSVRLTCTPIVDEHYHSDELCTQIANDLGKSPDQVIALMQGATSRKLRHLFFAISLDGKEVWKESIDATQSGAFDAKWFEQLQKSTSLVMSGQPRIMSFVPASDAVATTQGGSSGDKMEEED